MGKLIGAKGPRSMFESVKGGVRGLEENNIEASSPLLGPWIVIFILKMKSDTWFYYHDKIDQHK